MSGHGPPVSISNSPPFSLEFLVEDKKRLLRESGHVRRTQELFSVQVACFTHLPHQKQAAEWVRIGGNSQEHVEKAKVSYLFVQDCC